METLADLTVSEDTILEACGDRSIPPLGVIEQQWETDPLPVDELPSIAARAATELDFDEVPQGGEVAVGVGSRGIANLAAIVAGVIDGLEDMGYEPFVFPAMGSHGGATAEGQTDMLATLGVTEDAVGCEIRASMDVERVGSTASRNVPVYADANAVAADAILPINRVKPHTDYDGDLESGLAKMLVIGMGKQRGAKTTHEWAIDWSFRNMIPEITEQLLETLPIVGGVAIVEDQLDETAIVEGVPAGELVEREQELLETAYELLPRLPFDELDVLVLDRQGKNISGQGIDPNVIGRRPFAINEAEPASPDIKRIFVRRLTPESHGNAMGIGSADFVHRDLVAELESEDTFVNALTAATVRGVRIPPVVETDRAGLIAALSAIGVVDVDDVRLLRATDTMRLQRLYASPALVEAARGRDDLEVVREPETVEFEDDGTLVAPSPASH